MSRASVRSNGDVRGVKIDTNTSDVAAWDDTGSTDEGGADVGDDSTVQVGHDHDVELARAGDQLHGTVHFGWGLGGKAWRRAGYLRVIDNHVIELDARGLVLFCNPSESVEEKPITELHDVRFVDACDLLAVVLQGKVECEARDALCFGPGRDLQALDDAGVALVLQSRIFSLGVLTNDGKVDVRMSSGESREGLAQDH